MDSIKPYEKVSAPKVYVFLIALVTVGLPLSRFVMSLSEILLLLYWIFWIDPSLNPKNSVKGESGDGISRFLTLLKKNTSYRLRLFFNNKPAVTLASVYVLHLIGVLYSSNWDYAAKDLRIKLPLLIFPLVFSSMPQLNKQQFNRVMATFVGAVTVGVLLSFLKYFNHDYADVRELSPFISPIRFSLNVLFALVVLIYYVIYDQTVKTMIKAFLLLLSVVFLYFLMIIESITALGTLLVIVFVFAMIYWFKIRSLYLKIAIVLAIAAVPVFLTIYVYRVVEEATTAPAVDRKSLDKTTKLGNSYKHDFKLGVEDGKYVGLYLCEKELRQEWNKRSRLDYDGKALNGDDLSSILIRYLTSKGYRKDAAGVDSLSAWDVEKIEEGIANVQYVIHPGLRSRILKIILGYQRYKATGDPSGNSVMQRVEYLKGAFLLIKKHLWFGVGTGDFQDQLYRQYKEMGSKLKKKFIFHPHNQFVSVTIMFGVVGLLWFLFALLYPPLKLQRFNDYFFLSFFVMIVLSMFSDDTLDTQAGATLFAFFYSFLLLAVKEKKSLYISFSKS